MSEQAPSSVRAGPRVLLLSPVGTRVNPYIGLLAEGLAAAGAQVRLVDRLDPSILIGPDCPAVIHLHWLDWYDLPPPLLARPLHAARDPLRGTLRRVIERTGNAAAVYQFRRGLRLRRLFRQLRAFQRAGGCVAFTMHNLDPHAGAGAADRRGTAEIVRLADVIHVHDQSTAAAVAARFNRRSGVSVIPHGHYIDRYANTMSRSEARIRLGLPEDAFVYACVGLLRPYKGLEELLPAFRGLPDPVARLILAGQAATPAYAAKLAALAGDDPRIRFDSRLVPAEEVQSYYNAADVCVLPYRQITTSGAALLAFSFGLPIIAPAIGAFPELVTGRRGILYGPDKGLTLGDALARAQETGWSGVREEILAWVGQFDWQGIGERLLAAYGKADHQSLHTITDNTWPVERKPSDS